MRRRRAPPGGRGHPEWVSESRQPEPERPKQKRWGRGRFLQEVGSPEAGLCFVTAVSSGPGWHTVDARRCLLKGRMNGQEITDTGKLSKARQLSGHQEITS